MCSPDGPHEAARRWLATASALIVLGAGATLGRASGEDATPEPVAAPDEPVPADELGERVPLDEGGGGSLRTFHGALRRSARDEGQTRIVVYGASHVAADLFTRVLRHRLQDRFGDAGPGFVVPGPPWRSYHQRDVALHFTEHWRGYRVGGRHSRDDGLYGLAGATFVSDGPGARSRLRVLGRDGGGPEPVDWAELYVRTQPGGGALEVTVDGDRTHELETSASGDGGSGYLRLEPSGGLSRLSLRPKGDGPVQLYGVALERRAPGVVMDTLGINGARLTAQLQWDVDLFTEHLQRRDPDLVVLAYGTNAVGDAGRSLERYERRFARAVERVRLAVPEASCIILGPTDRPKEVQRGGRTRYTTRPRQPQVVAVQTRVARRYRCGYWDAIEAMGGHLSMVQWVHAEPRLGQKDLVHLTKAGYRRLADLFHEALMSGYAPPSPVGRPAR